MKCTECDAISDKELRVAIRVGCSSFSAAQVCLMCGRLHWPGDGTAVFARNGDRAFLNLKSGNLYNKPVETAAP